MKEIYNFYMLQSDMLCGPHGRGGPGQEKVSAGYPHPTAFLPAGTSRGQPPPGKKIVIRGREPCGGRGYVLQACLNDVIGQVASCMSSEFKEVGSGKLEAGSWKLEVGSWKLEVGSWKLEVGSWKLEAGRRKTGDGRQRTEDRRPETATLRALRTPLRSLRETLHKLEAGRPKREDLPKASSKGVLRTYGRTRNLQPGTRNAELWGNLEL